MNMYLLSSFSTAMDLLDDLDEEILADEDMLLACVLIGKYQWSGKDTLQS